MLNRWAIVLSGLCCGLCLSASANTTAPESIGGASAAVVPVPAVPATMQTAQNDLALPPSGVDTPPPAPAPATARIALLLPLRSETLGAAANVLRAGFMAAHEREPAGIEVNVVETGDAPQEVLSGYASASEQHDIIVGPLSRSGVAAVAQDGAVSKPTIALTPPESQDGEERALPRQMLVMGLSIEDEARQAANWASADSKLKKAFVIHTPAAWQRRAARAFEAQWQRLGGESELVELAAVDGYLNGRSLLQLKKHVPDDQPTLLFAALDAQQARQLRAIMGSEIALYGTSQLNPFSLADASGAERAEDMNGARLLDIPWQLQPDHPAVMVYPRLVVNADEKRSADMERLYALGIDAYRVAYEIASRHTEFQLDGVTGKLKVRFGRASPRFERTIQHAVYRDGGVVVATEAPQ